MESPKITAYAAWGYEVQIIPAYRQRDWMQIGKGHPYHCLPMVMANQSGWFVLAPHPVIAEWDGTENEKCVKVEIIGDVKMPQAHAYPSTGILSWTIPYIFRTSPGWNILCRGPSNMAKDGIAPLEGLIETDWAVSSFSMNWRFTRPGTIRFEKDEPIAMLVPQKRGDLELFEAQFAELSTNPELEAGYTKWITERNAFIAAQQAGDPDALKKRHLKGYFHGKDPHGNQFDEHQMYRKLSEFKKSESPDKS